MRSLFSILVGLLFVENVHSLNEGLANDVTSMIQSLPTREISLESVQKFLAFQATAEFHSVRPSNRNLQGEGHVWKACSGNVTDNAQMVVQNNTEYTQSIYEYTTYDDKHQPVCTCFYDKLQDDYWAQCALGDEVCNPNTGACSGTHEFFLFDDTTGNLQQKSSCRLCQDISNCQDIQETCTLVAFDENSNPSQCVLKAIHSDGSQSVCGDCSICQDPQTSQYGVFYDCFERSTLACETSGTAHLHNFEPLLKPETEPIGGTFARDCQDPSLVVISHSIEFANMEGTCVCPDPRVGVITCDWVSIFSGATEITEIYYYDAATGDSDSMTHCDLNLCSTVQFPASNKPQGCLVFDPHTLETCETCTFCLNEMGGYLIRYDCFGYTLGDDQFCPNEDTSSPTTAPANNAPVPKNQAGILQTMNDGSSPFRGSNQNIILVQGLAIGAVTVVAFLAILVTLACRPKPVFVDQETVPSPSEELRTGMDDPPEVLVDQDGQPMVQDPTPILLT